MTDMVYKKLIEDKELAHLKELIGLKLRKIYSDGLNIYNGYIESQLFTINCNENNWVSFNNNFFETPNDNDYYHLQVNYNKTPPKLKYDVTLNAITSPFSSINFKPMKINSIEIYSRHEFYENEELLYDSVLLFRGNKNRQLIIALELRADQPLIYSQNVDKYISELQLRIIIDNV